MAERVGAILGNHPIDAHERIEVTIAAARPFATMATAPKPASADRCPWRIPNRGNDVDGGEGPEAKLPFEQATVHHG